MLALIQMRRLWNPLMSRILLRLWSLNQRNRNVSVWDDESPSHSKESTGNEGPDNVVSSSEEQQEPMDTATNETTFPVDVTAYSVPLDKFVTMMTSQSRWSKRLPSNPLAQLVLQHNYRHFPTILTTGSWPRPSKQRKLGVGDLMVRPNVTKRSGLGKSLRQFKAPKRPEVTRLLHFDESETVNPLNMKATGKSSGKDGRSLVTDLIR